ncbi:alpha/beta fold hydrolase [Kribbella sp. NPDC058245]|uniref:alpha/beta fold hydrolase n=1 Tax=Kribbella sp. NPDC058245 TaxID=3346399 RepID=UPI0036F11F02
MTSILTSLLTRSATRRRNARRLAEQSPDGIYEGRFVTVGGIEQWLTIRGEDRRNPVLFFLHGGPGCGHTIFNALTVPWERHFTLVQWDQRGSGKTRDRSGPLSAGEWTLEQLESDAIEVAEFLRSHLGHDKVVLVASSVGSSFGLAMARHRPDLLHAYVGTDQNTGPAATPLSYRLTLEKLRAAGNTKGVKALEAIGPERAHWTARQATTLDRWTVKADTAIPNMLSDVILPAMIGSSEHTLRDLGNIMKGMDESGSQWREAFAQYDASAVGTDFAVPFFILQGDSDAVTPTSAAKDYFDAVTAPHKEFALIKHSGHLAMFTRPEQFLDELIRRVRPVAMTEASEMP